MAQKVEALDQRRYRRQTKQGGCRPVIYIDIYWTTTHSAQEVGRRIKWVSMIRKERRCHLKSVPTATNWMATMKYEQMEACGVYKRIDIDKKDFDALIKASLDEYPTFNREYEESCILK